MRLLSATTCRVFVMVTIWSTATPAQTHPYKSPSEVASADKAELIRVLRLRKLNPSDRLDNEVLSIVKSHAKHLYGRLELAVPDVFWGVGEGCYSSPNLGVVLDKQQLAALISETGANYRTALSFVLAHEMAHFGQFQIYDPFFMEDQSNTRLTECQADLLGAKAVIAPTLGSSQTVAQMLQESRGWPEFALRLGSPGWMDQNAHPRPDQRLMTIGLGIDAALASARKSNMAAQPAEVSAVAIADDFWWSVPVCARLVGWHDVTSPPHFRLKSCFDRCNRTNSCLHLESDKLISDYIERELGDCARQYASKSARTAVCRRFVPMDAAKQFMDQAGEVCLKKNAACSERCQLKPLSSDSGSLRRLNDGFEQPRRTDCQGRCLDSMFSTHRVCLSSDYACSTRCLGEQLAQDCREFVGGAYCSSMSAISFLNDDGQVEASENRTCLDSCRRTSVDCHAIDGIGVNHAPDQVGNLSAIVGQCAATCANK